MNLDEARELFGYLTPGEKAELDALIAGDLADRLWVPLPGPQTMAYDSQADVIGFGGSAGGGKTDLAIGKALMQFHETLIIRREGTQMQGILHRLQMLLGTREGFTGQPPIWRNAGPRDVLIEFGSCPNLGDEQRQQGRPHGFLVFDEATGLLELQVRFLLGWNRSTREGEHSQCLMTFNPPTDAEGRWVIDFFAPWLDKKHPLYPTQPGVLRYCAMLPQPNGTSRDVWVADATPFVLVNEEMVHNFDPAAFRPEDVVTPQSRTFIPSRISDNPHLLSSGYLRQLQAMPEPLRSQMLYGDFQAGVTDDPWQVCPTEWVEAAQARWVERRPRGEMLTQGVDVARGGKDNTTIANRHKTATSDYWFDKLMVYPGKETPDGPMTAGLVIGARRDEATILLDVIGVGASPYDVLNGMGLDVYGVNVSTRGTTTDRSGKMTFLNLRSQLWWKFRELLDPAHDTGIALPPDSDLFRELCAPRWKPSGMTIAVESRDDIIARIGRSPDRATAVVLAAMDVPKRSVMYAAAGRQGSNEVLSYDPLANLR